MWLETEARGRQLLFLVLGCLLLKVLWAYGIVGVLSFFRIELTEQGNGSIEIRSWGFVALMILVVLSEEMMYRLPLGLLANSGWRMRQLIGVAVIISMVFGFVHGGFAHILVQGVGGFFYSLLFLKAGGYHRNLRKAFAVTAGAHLTFNGIVTGVVIMSGQTMF